MSATLLEDEALAAVPEGEDDDRILRKVSRDDFWTFVLLFWDQVPGAAPLVQNWHMKELCDQLEVVARRVFLGLPVLHDLIFNVPPGTSKSTICSILFPAWVWANMPQARILSASHTNDLVMDLATKARAVITGDLYSRLFPEIVLTDDQDVKTYYRNTLGGDRYTCTVSGRSPTGFHAHLHLCDDLIDPKRARSQLELHEAAAFLTDILPSRKVDKATTPCVLIMQRLCPGDPTDVMLGMAAKEGATPVYHVCLPAEASDRVQPPELRVNYVDGLLDVSRLSKAILKRERARMTLWAYEAQYGQNPVPPGGSMFRPEGFNNRQRSAPYEAKRVFAVDRASTHDGGCYTACVLMARDKEGRCWIEDVIHGQWEPDERNAKILAAMLRYRRKYGRYEPRCLIEMEGGSSGVDAFKGLQRKLAGFKVRHVKVTGSKDVRAEPWADYVAGGNVLIVDNGESESQGRASWDVNGFVEEHVRFRPEPGKRLGGLKDRVDACSLGFNHLFAGRGVDALPLRVLTFGARKGGPPVRFVVADPEELAALSLPEPAVLVHCCDPAQQGEPDPVALPEHGLERLVGSVVLPFADLSAEELLPEWDKPMEGFGKKPEQVLASKEVARKLWAVLLRKYDQPPRFVVFTGEGDSDGRPLSVALAVCAGLNYKPDETFVKLADQDDNISKGPPNRYVFDTFRAARSSVVG